MAKDIKKSIGDGQPCPGMMDHNEHSLLRWHCLTLSDIISLWPIWADLTGGQGGFNYDFRFPRSLKQENQSQFAKCYLGILLRCVSVSEELRRLPTAPL